MLALGNSPCLSTCSLAATWAVLWKVQPQHGGNGGRQAEGPAVALWGQLADITCCITCTLLRALMLSPGAAHAAWGVEDLVFSLLSAVGKYSGIEHAETFVSPLMCAAGGRSQARRWVRER